MVISERALNGITYLELLFSSRFSLRRTGSGHSSIDFGCASVHTCYVDHKRLTKIQFMVARASIKTSGTLYERSACSKRIMYFSLILDQMLV